MEPTELNSAGLSSSCTQLVHAFVT